MQVEQNQENSGQTVLARPRRYGLNFGATHGADNDDWS